jgi:hypothetical protein
MRHKRYFYGLMARYVGYYVPRAAMVAEVRPRSTLLREAMAREMAVVDADSSGGRASLSFDELAAARPDRIVLNGCIHFADDVLALLEQVRRACSRDTRVVVTYFSSLWKPAFRLASRMGFADTGGEQNWLAPSDVINLLDLAGFDVVAGGQRVLLPVYVPLLSDLVNRWLAPLPGFRLLALANVAVARPRPIEPLPTPSVSVVVPARNERGNIQSLVDRLPAMGPDDELIFVEGHSTDGTWEEICRVASAAEGRAITCLQQKGRGKGDAVRLGFAHASREILMILDADLSVPPEVLPRFYRTLVEGKGDFINGSRLVYPMDDRAMRFANLVGNKFFAAAFSFLLGQPLKDTLCGTKVLRRTAYEAIAAERPYFGDFDPFGDFDLLFGASRQALKIVELPVRYRERVYGQTNIRRWTHGWLLLKMVVFAARRLKFI